MYMTEAAECRPLETCMKTEQRKEEENEKVQANVKTVDAVGSWCSERDSG